MRGSSAVDPRCGRAENLNLCKVPKLITHHLNEDGQSGYFADDYGRSICRWTWDTDSSTLRVRVGNTERPVDLSAFGIDRLSHDKLQERLIGLAKSTGEELGASFED